MAAKIQKINAEQGAALAVLFTGAESSMTGRDLVLHVRSDVADITVKLTASSDDGRLSVASASSVAMLIGSDVMAAVSVTKSREQWVYDLESSTSATDVRRDWQGIFEITRDVTRDTEPDEEERLAGLVRYDSPQTLTTEQKLQARENIGAGSGGSGSGDVVGPASATDDRIAAFDGTTGKLIKQGSVTATAVASHLSSTSNPHSVTAAQVGADAAGTAATAVGALAATLGTAATKDVGTTAGTVAAGDDSRITGAVQTSRTVSAAGLATGGGDLSANRTITVTAASTTTTEAWSSTSEALTPGGLKNAAPPYVEWGASADKTLALTDANVDQWCNNGATARVLTIPTNATVAFSTGTQIPGLRLGSGTCTVDAPTGVTLNGVDGGSCTVSTQGQGFLLTKTGTNAWWITGDRSAVA